MSLLSRWSGPILVGAVGAAMTVWTWDTWPDPVTDFGKEVYIAWQLSQGKLLYQDVAYHLGPLSPYFNAAIFKLFGPSLATIEYCNLLLLALMVVLMYRLVDRIAGSLAAAAGCVAFLTLFALAHFTTITDYNYVCPYDHAHTHGLLLGLLGLTAAGRYGRKGERWAVLLAGLFTGLAFFTRAELFVADALAVIATLLLTPSPCTQGEGRGGGSSRVAPTPWLYFLAGLLIPLPFPWLILPPHLAWRGFLGSWPIVLNTSVSSGPFYRDSMGTLNPGISLIRLVKWTVCWWVVVQPALTLAPYRKKEWIWAAGVWGVVAQCVILHYLDPADAFAPLPVALILCIWLGRKRGPLALGAMLWALLLLAKIFLNARIYQYGFALAMPATVLIIAATAWMAPPVRAAILGAMAVTILTYLGLAHRLMAQQIYAVGSGNDYFRADERGGMLNDCLLALKQQSNPGDTLAVMPEGAMLNFLARMQNPTPYWSFNPPYSFFAPGQGEAAGQAKIMDALISRPPVWVVVVAKNLRDFGTPFFGLDYGRPIYEFLQDQYRVRWTVGPPPFNPSGPAQPLSQFSVSLLRHRTAPLKAGATPGS